MEIMAFDEYNKDLLDPIFQHTIFRETLQLISL